MRQVLLHKRMNQPRGFLIAMLVQSEEAELIFNDFPQGAM